MKKFFCLFVVLMSALVVSACGGEDVSNIKQKTEGQHVTDLDECNYGVANPHTTTTDFMLGTYDNPRHYTHGSTTTQCTIDGGLWIDANENKSYYTQGILESSGFDGMCGGTEWKYVVMMLSEVPGAPPENAVLYQANNYVSDTEIQWETTQSWCTIAVPYEFCAVNGVDKNSNAMYCFGMKKYTCATAQKISDGQWTRINSECE